MVVPRIAALGHELVVSAPSSYKGSPLALGGYTIIGGARDLHGNDILTGDYQAHKADLLLTLCDPFSLAPSRQAMARMNVAMWFPVDCQPASDVDIAVLRDSQAAPIAMSRFGERMLRDEGCTPAYVPHGVDTTRFRPGDPNEGPFTIGINAVNKDASVRKRLWNQVLAFARFRERHPEARLMMHTAAQASPGLNLIAMALRLGITDAVIFPDLHAYNTGAISADAVAEWYQGLDILSNCANEGFGLAPLEAQASGVPVVVSDCAAGSELCGAGWKVPGELEWTDGHNAFWSWPYPGAIDAAYEAAWQAREDGKMPQMRDAAVEFAAQYEADRVFKEHWVPVLSDLEAGLT